MTFYLASYKYLDFDRNHNFLTKITDQISFAISVHSGVMYHDYL